MYLTFSEWFETETDVSVWFQINRKRVCTIWFRVDLIRFRKYFSVCILYIDQAEIASASRYHGSDWVPIQGHSKTPPTSQQYCVEGLKESPQLGPHYLIMARSVRLSDGWLTNFQSGKKGMREIFLVLIKCLFILNCRHVHLKLQNKHFIKTRKILQNPWAWSCFSR